MLTKHNKKEYNIQVYISHFILCKYTQTQKMNLLLIHLLLKNKQYLPLEWSSVGQIIKRQSL